MEAQGQAINLRAEIEGLRAQVARLQTEAKPRSDFWFTGDSSETAFVLPSGWSPLKVYSDGLLRKPGAAEDYTVTFDGHLYTVVFAVAPAAVDIAIEAGRS